jgi:hypothetical protein
MNTVSFYNSVNIKLIHKGFANTEYQFYNLCPLHNFPLATGPKLDAYLRFNTFCYTCPRCPEFYSIHYHDEYRSCKSSCCEPLRTVYRGECRPIHDSTSHNCHHHFYQNRIPIDLLGNILLPHHAYSPFFATEKAFHDAGDLFWCLSAPRHDNYPMELDEMEKEGTFNFTALFS